MLKYIYVVLCQSRKARRNWERNPKGDKMVFRCVVRGKGFPRFSIHVESDTEEEAKTLAWRHFIRMKSYIKTLRYKILYFNYVKVKNVSRVKEKVIKGDSM